MSTRDGDYAIYGVDAGGAHEWRLTKEKGDPSTPTGLFFELQPAWSPDGTRLLFARATAAGQTIDVMPAGGGAASVLTGLRGNEIPHWQPVTATAVTGVSPGQGPSAGGTTVTISGHGFVAGARVKFGGAAATHVVVHSLTSITATAPPGTGTVDVVVTTSRGTSQTSAADQFTYQ